MQVYKMCMSIGWNPFYKNKEKTAEPWILHDFDKVSSSSSRHSHGSSRHSRS